MFSNQGPTNSVSDLLRNIPAIGGLMAAAFNAGADVGDKVGKGLIRGLLSEVGGGRFRGLLAVGLAGALTALVSGSVALAVAQARSRLDLSQASGMSLSQASGAVTNLKAFGIDTDSVPGISQNSFFQQMQSGVYGVRGTPGSTEYLRSYHDRYQGMASQGPMGLMQAQRMEGSLGMGGARFMANLSQPDYDRQMKRSDAIQGAFGMKPEDIKRAAVDFSLFNASLSQFIELGLAKVGTTILPYLTGMLDHAIDWVSANGEKFSEGLVSAVQMGMNALMVLGKWLYASLPVIVVNVLRFLNSVVGSFAKSVTSGVDFVRGPIAGLFNGIGRMAVGVANLIGQTFTSVKNGLLSGFDAVMKQPLVRFGLSKLGIETPNRQTASEKATAFRAQEFANDPYYKNLTGAKKVGYEAFSWMQKHGLQPANAKFDSHVTPHENRVFTDDGFVAESYKPRQWTDYRATDVLGGLRNGAQGVSAWSDKTDKTLAGWQKSMGTQQERGKNFDAFTKLDEIAKNTKRSADATEKMPSILNQFGQQIVARALAYEKQDTTRNMMRGFSNI